LPLLVLVASLAVLAADRKPEDPKSDDDGFVPMFNGKDLSGWVNVNCAPGTFFVKDKEIITTGKPTGYLRTEKQYENFIAEFDWMHIPNKPGEVGNSGFFVWCDPIPAVGTGYTRGIEVQVLVNLTYKNKKGEITATSQGDLFSIHGAKCVPDRPHAEGWDRCLPSEDHCKGEGEWNHYRVEANDGVIKLTVNGHTVSGLSKCNPRKGYLALESEGSECHFRNLKIKERPSTDPKAEEIADVAKSFKSLYDGIHVPGWTPDDKGKDHWQPKDTVLHCDGKGDAKNNQLRNERPYASDDNDAEIIVDFRFPEKDAKPCTFTVGEVFRKTSGSGSGSASRSGPPSDGEEDRVTLTVTPDGKWSRGDEGSDVPLKPAGQWNRLSATQSGRRLAKPGWSIAVNGKKLTGSGHSEGVPGAMMLILSPEGEMDFANIFARDFK
jgi:hypothetical protein